MMKKLLLLMGLCITPLIGMSDEIATDLMILNNSNSQQFNDLWSRMRAGFKLDHTQNERVKYFENLYTKNPKAFTKLMNNAIPYLYFLLNEIERIGLPSELALIPGIESSYDMLAKNSFDAYAGMWQFMPGTGRRFFMEQNSSIDERRDLVKSTRSALNYLNYLHLMFHQWDVAIGAYNWGEGGMYRAILDSHMQLGKVQYSDLKLRQITADYVPKIIALACIIENPGKFGVTLDPAPNIPYFAIITPPPNTTVSEISKLSSVNNQTFTRLNAAYKDTNYQLSTQNNILLPEINQNIYYASIGQSTVTANNIQLANNDEAQMLDNNLKPASLVTVIPAKLTVIKSTSDKNLAETSENKINSSNSATSTTTEDSNALENLLDKIDPQENSAGGTTKRPVITKISLLAKKNGTIKYTVNPGDTLYSISKRFNADIKQIRSDNHILGNNLSTGQALVIKTTQTMQHQIYKSMLNH